MIFLTATAIGLLAGMTRNLFSMFMIALLIPTTFATAAVFSGSASWLDLAMAILGYNAGLLNLVVIGVLLHAAGQAQRA